MQYIIQNGGLTSESNYPYIGFQEVQCNLDAALIISARMRSYSPVTSNSYTSMAAALSSAPVVSMVDASGPIWQNYGGGVLDDPTCGTNLNHAILLIGYNLSASPSYWLGKNSWGASWGESGYVRVSIKPGAGVCGIQMSVVYPLI
jgi:C1A family cysteine protease